MLFRNLFATTLLLCIALSVSAQRKKPHVPAPSGDTCFEIKKAMPLFYQELKNDLKYPLAWRNAKKGTKFKAWHNAAYAELIKSLQPETPTVAFGSRPYGQPINVEAKSSATDANARFSYSIAKLEFSISKYSRAKSYLFVPNGEGPFPTVVLFHDHGASFDIGKEKMCDPSYLSLPQKTDSVARDWCHRCYDDQYVANFLAEHGYVVFVTDALMWGDRRAEGGTDYDVQQALSANLLQMGTSLGATIAWDDIHTIDFVSTLPQVDKSRIAVMGFSMGSFRAWISAAASPKVAACVAVCWMNTTDQLMTLENNQNKGGSAYCMLIPGLVRKMDYADVASLIAPRPVLFMNGANDKLFPVNGVTRAYQIMDDAWTAAGAKNNFESFISNGPHFFSKEMQQKALDFFDKHLKGKK